MSELLLFRRLPGEPVVEQLEGGGQPWGLLYSSLLLVQKGKSQPGGFKGMRAAGTYQTDLEGEALRLSGHDGFLLNKDPIKGQSAPFYSTPLHR